MKFVTAKYLSLMLLAAALTGSIQADHHHDNDGYVEDRGDCCRSSCYECGCNPLYCGAWDLQVQAGVSPIIWRNRGDVNVVACNTEVGGPVFTLFELPKFSKFFKTPWTVGGQIGYHWSDNARVYVEFNYIQAKHKSDRAFVIGGNLVTPGSTLSFLNGRKYKLFDGYVGARYYWDRWCDRVSFFLGGKVGFTHHKRANSDVAVVIGSAAAVTILTDQELFRRSTVVSGGADFGLDFCFCGNWSFVITGGVIAACGPDFPHNIVIPANQSAFTATNLLLGHIRTELRFPVTAGVRYSF